MLRRIVLLGLTTFVCQAHLLALASDESELARGSRTLAVGSRVRVTSVGESAQTLIGQVVALEPGVVVVRGEGGSAPSRVPVGPSTTIEVSAGRKSRAARGAMLGAAVGVLPGLLMTFGDYNTDEGNPAAVSVAGAAAGAAVGALVGLALRSEEWQPAELPAITATIAPVPRGAAISLRVTWGR